MTMFKPSSCENSRPKYEREVIPPSCIAVITSMLSELTITLVHPTELARFSSKRRARASAMKTSMQSPALLLPVAKNLPELSRMTAPTVPWSESTSYEASTFSLICPEGGLDHGFLFTLAELTAAAVKFSARAKIDKTICAGCCTVSPWTSFLLSHLGQQRPQSNYLGRLVISGIRDTNMQQLLK